MFGQSAVDLEAKRAGCRQCNHLWSEKLEKFVLTRLNRHLDSLLDHIITILVGEVLLKRPRLHDFCDHLASNIGTRALKALLDDIGGEFFLAESEQRTKQLFTDNGPHVRNLHVQNVLNHIVGIRVLHKNPRVPRYRLCQESLLLWVSCINALLHYAASMHVTGDLFTVRDHGVINELFVVR